MMTPHLCHKMMCISQLTQASYDPPSELCIPSPQKDHNQLLPISNKYSRLGCIGCSNPDALSYYDRRTYMGEQEGISGFIYNMNCYWTQSRESERPITSPLCYDDALSMSQNAVPLPTTWAHYLHAKNIMHLASANVSAIPFNSSQM